MITPAIPVPSPIPFIIPVIPVIPDDEKEQPDCYEDMYEENEYHTPRWEEIDPTEN